MTIMIIQHRRQRDLESHDAGWLKARHHFRVSAEGNPEHRPLGALIVWNDDEIAPGAGFPMHGHRDVEIISYIREGVVSHRDSAGGEGLTAEGDVQVMSAGSGIRHEEFNRGHRPLKLYQIWLQSNERGSKPRWENRPFPRSHRAGQLVTLASGMQEDEGAVPIRANARVLGVTLKSGETVSHMTSPSSKAYLVPAVGTLRVNGETVEAGDGIALADLSKIVIEATSDAEVVMVEVI
jgi:redox-sensitive bicupin YhaK (pirin superfamily)